MLARAKPSVTVILGWQGKLCLVDAPVRFAATLRCPSGALSRVKGALIEAPGRLVAGSPAQGDQASLQRGRLNPIS